MPDGLQHLAVDVLADGERTGGAYALFDVRTGQELAIGPHIAQGHDVQLWLIEGALTVVLDGSPLAVQPGDGLRLGRGVPRTLTLAPQTRVLCLAVPAGVEHLAVVAGCAVDVDDLAALLAAAEIRVLPRWS